MDFTQKNMMFAHQLDVSSKKQLFTKVSNQMLAHLDAEAVESEEAESALATQLLQREYLGTTAIGRGIALPHVVCVNTDTITCCIATSKRPISFDAADGRDVDLFGILLLPEALAHTAPAHLESLRQLLTQRGLRSKLRAVASQDDMRAIFVTDTDTAKTEAAA